MGGIANSVLELMPVLERIKNLEITLITKYSEYKPNSSLTKIITFLKFSLSKINTVYFFLKSFFKIVRINKKNRIHALYIPTYYYDSISPIFASILFKIPAYIKVPSDFETLQREVFMRYSRAMFSKMAYYGWMNFFRKFVAKNENVYYQAINEKIYNDLLDLRISKENILQLPNAISPEKYLKLKKHSSEETHYGFVGRLFKSKNIEFLLRVFMFYISKYPRDKLYIYGKGPEQVNLIKFIKERNLSENIILRGFEKDKRKIYSNIDVLIHPTFGEGSPNTILESCVTNTIVTASNVTGIRDIITHGKSGLLFNPLKEDDLLKQLIYYKQHQDLVPDILKSAGIKIVEYYNVETIGYKIHDFIRSIWIYKKRKETLKLRYYL